MIEQDLRNNGVEMYEPPKWLDDVLRRSFAGSDRAVTEFPAPSEAFHQRSRDAANSALSIIRLRNERRRIGFVPITLAEYIQGLVKVAGVQIESVLARFGIENISRSNSDSARKLARLAQELGISLREVLIHARIGFVERTNALPVPLLLAHHRSIGVRDQLGECEAALGMAEAGYDGELLNELHRTEFEIRAAYKQGESALDP
jgi:hypothetical protein